MANYISAQEVEWFDSPATISQSVLSGGLTVPQGFVDGAAANQNLDKRTPGGAVDTAVNVAAPVPEMVGASIGKFGGDALRWGGDAIAAGGNVIRQGLNMEPAGENILQKAGKAVANYYAGNLKELAEEYPLEHNSIPAAIRSGLQSTGEMVATWPVAWARGAKLLQAGAPAAEAAVGAGQAAITALSAKTSADAYAKYADRGHSFADATAGGLVEGVIEKKTEDMENLPFFAFLANPKAGGIKALARAIGKLGLAGQVTEQIATHAQEATDRIMGHPGMSWEQKAKAVNDYFAKDGGIGSPELWANALNTAVSTATMTTVMGGVGGAAKYLAGQQPEQQQQQAAAGTGQTAAPGGGFDSAQAPGGGQSVSAAPAAAEGLTVPPSQTDYEMQFAANAAQQQPVEDDIPDFSSPTAPPQQAAAVTPAVQPPAEPAGTLTKAAQTLNPYNQLATQPFAQAPEQQPVMPDMPAVRGAGAGLNTLQAPNEQEQAVAWMQQQLADPNTSRFERDNLVGLSKSPNQIELIRYWRSFQNRMQIPRITPAAGGLTINTPTVARDSATSPAVPAAVVPAEVQQPPAPVAEATSPPAAAGAVDAPDSVFSGAMAADYLLTGGFGVMLSTEYLLQAYSGLFQKSSAKVEQIRKKYVQEIRDRGLDNVTDFVKSDLFAKITSEMQAAVAEDHGNSAAVADIFNEVAKYPTGMSPKVGNAISKKIEEVEAAPVAEVPPSPAAAGVVDQIKPKQNTRRQLDPANDDLIVAIGKLGGMDKAQVEQQWGATIADSAKDLHAHASRQGVGFLQPISRKGKPLDEIRRSLEQHGYLLEGSSINDLLAKIDSHLRGKPSYSNQHVGTVQDQDLSVAPDGVEESEYPFDLEGINFPRKNQKRLAFLKRKLAEAKHPNDKKKYRDTLQQYLEKIKAEQAASAPSEVALPETPLQPAKQPWEMTRTEFVEGGGTGLTPYDIHIGNTARTWQTDDRNRGRLTHRGIIQEALAEGKPVPAEVLADYPDLQQASGPVSETTHAVTLAPDAKTAEKRKGEVGMKLEAGERVLTASGRLTTEFPKINLATNKTAANTLKRVDQWLMDNAIEEARSRGDKFNQLQFAANREKPSQADKDSAEQYLFGEKQLQNKSASAIVEDGGTNNENTAQVVTGSPEVSAGTQPDSAREYLENAASHARGVHGAVRTAERQEAPAPGQVELKGTQKDHYAAIKAKEVEALKQLMEDAGQFPADGFVVAWKSQGKPGETEHKIAVAPDKKTIRKFGNAAVNHTWADYLDRIQAHNQLFIDTLYTFKGLSEIDGELHSVIDQPYIHGNHIEKAPVEVIDKHMAGLGFKPFVRPQFAGKPTEVTAMARLWVHPVSKVAVWDVRPANVLYDTDLKVAHFIDPMIEHLSADFDLSTLTPLDIAPDGTVTGSKFQMVDGEVVPVDPAPESAPASPVPTAARNSKGNIELKFEARPDDAVIERLTSAGFKFNQKQKVWYAPDTADSAKLAEDLSGSTLEIPDDQFVESEPTSPRVQKLTDILASLDNLTGREEASAIDKMISGEMYEEIKPYDSHLAYKLMKKGEDGIPALLALNSGKKNNKDAIYRSQANDFKATLQEAIDLLTTKDAERARLAKEMEPTTAQPAKQPAGPVPMLLGEKIGGARKDLETTGDTTKPKKTASTVPAWRRRYIVSQVANRDSKHFEKWSILDDTTGRLLVRKFFDTAAEAEALLPLAVFGVKHRLRKGSNGTWGIVRDVTDRKRVTLKDGFETEEEAMRYVAGHAVELIEQNTYFGEEIIARPETVRREGPQHREGNATAKTFMDTFGFRSAEFGNWNNEAERQEILNYAFDSLMDMAELLNIPPKAVSLNGELAIAFGARGQGLSGAAAHYEPGYAVINLTKMAGAGHLFHEWIHAMDNYFARQDGRAKSEKEPNKRGDLVYPAKKDDMVSDGFRAKGSGVRQEVQDAFLNLMETIWYKTEQYIEDAEKAQRFVQNSLDNVANQLNDLRRHLVTERQYGSKKKPATAAQLERFDELAAKLQDPAGDPVEWRHGIGIDPNKPVQRGNMGQNRWTNDAIEELGALIKAVTGRSGFQAEGKGELNYLASRVRDLHNRNSMLQEAQNRDTKTKKLPTTFRQEAYKIDQGRTSDYWTEKWEMLARAGSAYIEDKLQSMDRRNDFLSFGSDNKYYRLFNIRPFPEGHERDTINAAFDNLFATLKTKETDKGVALYASMDSNTHQVEKGAGNETIVSPDRRTETDRGDGRAVPATDAELKIAIATAGKITEDQADQVVISQADKQLQQIAGLFGKQVVVYQMPEDGKDPGGFWQPALQDYIFISTQSTQPHFVVLGHELMHSLKREAPDLYKEMLRLNLTQQAIDETRKAAERSYGRKVSGPEVTEEALGNYLSMKFTDFRFWEGLSRQAPNLFEKAITVARALVRRVLDAIGGTYKSDHYFNDIRKADRVMTNVVATYARRAGNGGLKRIDKGTDEAVKNLSAWHGSPHDHDKFSTDKIGTGEGAQAYGWGLYFAGAREVAEFYRKNLSDAAFSAAQVFVYRGKSYSRGDSVLGHAMGLVHDRGIKEARRMAKSWIGTEKFSNKPDGYFSKMVVFLNGISGKKDFEVKSGRLYKVELAPADDEYLLWDKPLSEQSEKVKAALGNLDMLGKGYRRNGALIQDLKGSILYKGIAATRGEQLAEKSGGAIRPEPHDKWASEYLHSLGIRGIKYLDGTSRGKGDGNYNYVIFNDADVTIVTKFSLNNNAESFTGLQAADLKKEFGERVQIVQRPDQMPEKPAADAAAMGVKPYNIEAFVHNGQVWLVAENIRSISRARELAFGHELAHLGQDEKVVDLAVEWFKATTSDQNEGFKKKAHDLLQEEADKRKLDLGDPEQYRTAVREATARLAEDMASNGVKPGLIQKIVNHLRQLLRRMYSRLKVTDQELAGAVAEMLRAGHKRLNAATSYSLKPEPFYSAVERMVRNAKQNAWGSAKELTSWLTGKVTADEIKQLGLDTLEGKLTKQQVLDEIAANSIEFKDVVLGVNVDVSLNQDEKNRFAELEELDRLGDLRDDQRAELTGYRRRAFNTISGGGTTHFSQYTEPGAVDGSYREMFVTAPVVSPTTSEKAISILNEKGYALGRDQYVGAHLIQTETGKKLENSDYTSELRRLLAAADDEHENWLDGHSQYNKIQNPVVRIRFNEREVPADYGIVGGENKAYAVVDHANDDQVVGEYDTREEAKEVVARGKRILFIEEMQPPTKSQIGKMPDYLKNRAYAIGVKRILAYAKEHGYDGVAWTSDQQQLNRWGTERIDWKQSLGAGKGLEVGDIAARIYSSLDGSHDQRIVATINELQRRYDATDSVEFKNKMQREMRWAELAKLVFTVSMKEQEGGNADGVNIEETARQRGQLLEENGTTITSKDELLALIKRNLREGVAENIADKVWKQMQDNPEGTYRPRHEFMKSIYGTEKGPQNLGTLFAKYGGEKVGAVNLEGEYVYSSAPSDQELMIWASEKFGVDINDVTDKQMQSVYDEVEADKRNKNPEREDGSSVPYIPITDKTPGSYTMFSLRHGPAPADRIAAWKAAPFSAVTRATAASFVAMRDALLKTKGYTVETHVEADYEHPATVVVTSIVSKKGRDLMVVSRALYGTKLKLDKVEKLVGENERSGALRDIYAAESAAAEKFASEAYGYFVNDVTARLFEEYYNGTMNENDDPESTLRIADLSGYKKQQPMADSYIASTFYPADSEAHFNGKDRIPYYERKKSERSDSGNTQESGKGISGQTPDKRPGNGTSLQGQRDNGVAGRRSELTEEQLTLFSLRSRVSEAASAIPWEEVIPAIRQTWIEKILKKQTANPLDFSRAWRVVEDEMPGMAEALEYYMGVPSFQAERDPAKLPFFKAGSNREETKTKIMMDLLGFIPGQDDERSLLAKVKDFAVKWDSNISHTDWEKLNRRKFELTPEQKKALDLLFVEGDTRGREYTSLQTVRMNPRLNPGHKDCLNKAAARAIDATTFALYQDIRAHLNKVTEMHLKWMDHLMMQIPDMTDKEREKHISELRNRMAKMKGWLPRDHGEGDIQVAAYHVFTADDIKRHWTTKKIEGGKQLILNYYPGNTAMETIRERVKAGWTDVESTVVFTDNDHVVITLKGTDTNTGSVLDDVNAALAEAVKGDIKVMSYMRRFTGKGAARRHAEKVRKNLKGAMPLGYLEGHRYEVADPRVMDDLTEDIYQALRGDMATEAALKKSLEKAFHRGEMDAEEYQQLKAQLVRDTAEVMMARGAGRYQIRRTPYLIEGYETEDVMSLYQDYIMGLAGMLSKSAYALEQHQNLEDAPNHVKKWARRYTDDNLRNMTRADRLSGDARALISLTMMGFRVSSAMINATQPYTQGVAELGRQLPEGSEKGAIRLIAAAQKDIVKNGLSLDEKALFDTAIYRQQEAATVLNDVSGHGEGTYTKASKVLHALTGKSLALFQHIEIFNRKSVILASYRAFRDPSLADGVLDQAAFDKALEVNRKVNFEMGRHNLPAWAMGSKGRLLYSLMGFSWNSLNWIFNRMTSGEKRDQVALLRYAGMLMLLAGPMALPGGDELDKLYRKLRGRSLKVDFEAWTRKQAEPYGTIGEMANAFAWHGLLSGGGYLVNVSNALRLQLPIVSDLLNDESVAESFAGVPGAMVKKAWNSAEYASRGDYWKATEAAAPEAVAGAMRAYRMATEGATTVHGKMVPDEQGQPLKYSAVDAVKRGLGFQPYGQSKRAELTHQMRQIEKYWDDKRQDVMDDLRKNVNNGKGFEKALKKKDKFNEALVESQALGLVTPIDQPAIRRGLTYKPNKKQTGWKQRYSN